MYHFSGVLAEEQLQIVLYRDDNCNAEALNENLCHVGVEESRQGGAQVDILDAQVQQDQQYDNSLLLISGDIVNNGQVAASRPKISFGFRAMTAKDRS